MSIELESRFCLSNDPLYISRYDDLMITDINTIIKVDHSEDLSEEKEDDYYNYEKVEIGYIYAKRFNLSQSHERDLCMLADAHSQDLIYFAGFWFSEEREVLGFPEYLYYIEKVFIKPEYRGKGYAIQALALFLEGFAWGHPVGCHPFPLEDLKDKYSEDKAKLLMRKYWSKVGLDRYSSKENILWTDEWNMPEWLKHKLFDEDE